MSFFLFNYLPNENVLKLSVKDCKKLLKDERYFIGLIPNVINYFPNQI
jgi:hypothetical protein